MPKLLVNASEKNPSWPTAPNWRFCTRSAKRASSVSAALNRRYGAVFWVV